MGKRKKLDTRYVEIIEVTDSLGSPFLVRLTKDQLLILQAFDWLNTGDPRSENWRHHWGKNKIGLYSSLKPRRVTDVMYQLRERGIIKAAENELYLLTDLGRRIIETLNSKGGSNAKEKR
jgi:hypothetical protein